MKMGEQLVFEVRPAPCPVCGKPVVWLRGVGGRLNSWEVDKMSINFTTDGQRAGTLVRHRCGGFLVPVPSGPRGEG